MLNISFFSLFYVTINSKTIYNDIFAKENINISEEEKELQQPTFLLYRWETNTDYKSFPWKDILEDSIKILDSVSNTNTGETKDIKPLANTEAVTVVKPITKKIDTIIDLSHDMSKEEWEKYKDWSYVVIPKVNIEAPINYPSIEEYDLEAKILKLLEDWVVHRPETQMPDQNGNVFLIWHSSNYPWIKSKYNDIFAWITKLKEWDKVYVYYKWRKFIYTLYTTFIVPPTAVDVYWYLPWNVLTLMTCYPLWTDKNRYIARFTLDKP